jgi:hypothetical protein
MAQQVSIAINVMLRLFHLKIESNFQKKFHGRDYAWLCRFERSTRSEKVELSASR